MKKIISCFLFFVFVLNSVSAYTFGVLPGETDRKISDLSEKIEINFINTGDTGLEVIYSSPESDEYNVSFPDQEILKPSEIVSSPEGKGRWYEISSGEYVELQESSFRVKISKYRDSNLIHVPVTLSISPTDTGYRNSASILTQERTLNYTIKIDSALRPHQREGGSESELTWGEDPPSFEDKSGSNENPDVNVSKDYKASNTEENLGGQNPVNSITYMLIACIIGLTVYITKVI